MKKLSYVLAASVFALVAGVGTGMTNKRGGVSATGENPDIITVVSPLQKSTVKTDNEYVADYFKNYTPNYGMNFYGRGDILAMNGVDLKWECSDGRYYSVYVDTKANFSSADIYTTVKPEISIYNLLPDADYYWKVKRTDAAGEQAFSRVYTFRTRAYVRAVTIEGVSNVRDLGGWTTSDGKKIKYGTIYRSAQLENVTENGKIEAKRLGIKTDVDLRGMSSAVSPLGDGVKKVQISRLDGTKTEIVNVVSGYYSDVSDKDITVKVNAELLADENGEVAGFKMNIIDGSCDHFVFSAMNGLATEKKYSVIYKADGANDIIKTFTKSTKSDFEIPAVPTKEHYTGVWENHDIIYADNQVVNAVYTPITYTATFRADGADDQIVNYTIENKDTITVPTVPAREHYTGEWNEFTLNFDNEQVITAKYTATRYTVTFKADGETVATETYTVENKTVNEPAVPAKKGYDGAWSKYELNFENIEVTAEYTFGKAAGFSVSLAGDIGLNFYATLSADTDEMTAQVTFKGETVTVKGVKTDKVAGNAFVFRFPVAPKDYKENVAFVVTTLGGDTITATSSVKEYADKFAEGEDGYALVQKMLAYCEAARVYFAAETVDTAKDFTADLTAFAATVSGTDDDITVEGATLVLEDTTEIKLYFTCADLTGKTFKVGNSEVTPEAVTGVENCYVLRLKNIVMKDIDELYDFTLGGKTVRYGALSYVKATLEDKDTSVSLGNLVKTLYELNVAANAYFAA